jgi:hypothetical protein
MASTPGPDDETWNKMSPLAKRIYWAFVSIIITLVGGGFLYSLIFN